MSIRTWLSLLASLCFVKSNLLELSYQCGIRKHSFVELVHEAYNVEEGQWPWHVGLFHKTDGSSPKYACGGTLLDQKHILTAAHCVWNRNTRNPLPADSIELHFGQQNLSEITPHVQIRDVSKIHVHPDYSTHRNDIAVLVMRLPVEYTDFVIPICLDRGVDIDLRNLEDQRGWIAGWGTTESVVISDVLRSASMPVVSYLQCLSDVLNQDVFCAGDRNGTSPSTGDSGGGMYFSEGDRWVLRGIVSFAKIDEMTKEFDTSKYVVFVNVQRFLTWIKEIVDKREPEVAKGPKRISEQECDRFKGLVGKKEIGICSNSRYPHTVSLIYNGTSDRCSGFLVNENHVLTSAACITEFHGKPDQVQFDSSIHDILNMTGHPQHRIGWSDNNLAVIKLKTSVHLSSNMVPACLASNWTENLYDTLLQIGFGEDEAGRTFIESDENQVIAAEDCKRVVGRRKKYFYKGVRSAQLCVSNRDRLRTRHFESSGGSLQSVNSRTCMYTVVGILSDLLHVDENNPWNITEINLYTRVAYHLDWIEQIVWNVEPPMMTTNSIR